MPAVMPCSQIFLFRICLTLVEAYFLRLWFSLSMYGHFLTRVRFPSPRRGHAVARCAVFSIQYTMLAHRHISAGATRCLATVPCAAQEGLFSLLYVLRVSTPVPAG